MVHEMSMAQILSNAHGKLLFMAEPYKGFYHVIYMSCTKSNTFLHFNYKTEQSHKAGGVTNNERKSCPKK